MCNDCFALHNTPEARDFRITPTRGLNHSVTTGRTPCNGKHAKGPRDT